MKTDPWSDHAATTLRQRFIAETEQLIDRKNKRVEQLMEEAQREEIEIVEAREMLQFLKAGSLNGRTAVQTPEPAAEDVQASKSQPKRSYVDRTEALKVVEGFEGRGFTTMEFAKAAGLKDRKSVVAKLKRGVDEGVLEQVRQGQGSAPTIWRARTNVHSA